MSAVAGNALNVVVAGDINLVRHHRMDPERALALVADELNAADFRVANLEGCFSDPSVELAYKPGWRHVEPEMSVALDGLIDAVGCANNVHYGQAIVDSLERLDALGVAHFGAGRDRAESRAPAVVEVKGRRVGMLAFTSVFWPVGAAATESSPGVATIKAYSAYQPHERAHDMPGGPATVLSWPDEGQLAEACEAVSALRERVDVVIVYCHWGVALAEEPAAYQRTVGRALIDAGVDLVVGSSPHVPQGVEAYGGGAILHSLGNFIFGSPGRRNDTRTGLVARATFDDSGLTSLAVVPVVRNDDDQAVLLRVDEGEGAEIAAFVVEASAKLGTRATFDTDALEIELVH